MIYSKITILTAFLLISQLLCGQREFKINPNSNQLHISNVDECTIKGYNGNEVVIINDDFDDDISDKMNGLRLINNSGLTDNSGIGLSVQNKNDQLVIKNVSNKRCGSDEYTIKVPHDMNINYEHSNYNGDDLMIDNISGEIEISANYNDIYLSNVTGPMAIKTVYGSIEVEFEKLSSQGSITLYSVYDYVEAIMIKGAQLSLNVSSSYGNFYSDMEIALDGENQHKKRGYGTDVNGKVNNGGVEVNLTSTYDNVYLRTKK